MKNIGLIGTGKHGSRYAGHIVHDVDGLTLAAISRRSAAGTRQAADWHCHHFKDWRELVMSTEVEAVIAVTPPSLNLEITRLCATVGKPLLLEKPLARNGAEAAEIVALMAAANCPLSVGQTLRYNPVIHSLKKQLPGLGTLHSLAVNQRLEPSSLDWHDDPDSAGAGVIIHTAVHIFDALRVITGLRIKRVMAAHRSIHSRRLEDLVTALLEFDNGVLGTLDVSKVGRARSGRYEFICQEGQLHGDQIHGFTKIISQGSAMVQTEHQQVPTILPLLQDWAAFLESGKDNPVSGEDGAYAVAVCDACRISASEQRWVEVEDTFQSAG